MDKIYFAAPLFCAGERAFNDDVVKILEKHGYSVFLPQRDGILAAELADMSPEEKVKTVFSKDYSELRGSDILLFVVDGRVPDEGACVELGMAYSLGKRCYGIRSDVRALEEGLPINPMIRGCLRELFECADESKLLSELDSYLDTHSL